MATPPWAAPKPKTTVWQRLLITASIVVGTLIVISAAADYYDKHHLVEGNGYPAHSITDGAYRATTIGGSLTSVKAYLGEPESVQRHEYGNGSGGTSTSSCIYYSDLNGNTGVYQFCFDNGTLTSKAKY